MPGCNPKAEWGSRSLATGVISILAEWGPSGLEAGYMSLSTCMHHKRAQPVQDVARHACTATGMSQLSKTGAGIMGDLNLNLSARTTHPLTHPPATMRREMSVTPAGTVKLEVPTCKGC
jgi:hypothetical protein